MINRLTRRKDSKSNSSPTSLLVSFKKSLISSSVNISLKAFNFTNTGGKSPTVTRPDWLLTEINWIQQKHFSYQLKRIHNAPQKYLNKGARVTEKLGCLLWIWGFEAPLGWIDFEAMDQKPEHLQSLTSSPVFLQKFLNTKKIPNYWNNNSFQWKKIMK